MKVFLHTEIEDFQIIKKLRSCLELLAKNLPTQQT